MNLKCVGLLCFALALLLLLGACGSKTIDPDRDINEPYFGEELYAEVRHDMTREEKTVGEDVLRQMREVLEYTGAETDADTNVGALSRYYWFPYHDQPAKAETSAELVNCVKQDNGFHVWVLYSKSLYDQSGKLLTGCRDILTLLTAAPDGDGWTVIEAREHP